MQLKEKIKKLAPTSVIRLYHYLLAQCAAILYGHPSRKLIVIGVTGTKGKSTTTILIAKILESLGERVGYTSTIGFQVAGKEWLNEKKMTMLGRFALQKILSDMVHANCSYAVIETSSEGIAQSRHANIEYDVAVFTNLTPEHIESHGSFENYRAAKEKLFAHLTRFPQKTLRGKKIQKIIITNADDEESARILNFPADKKLTFGTKTGADIIIEHIVANRAGSDFHLNATAFSIPLLGEFNSMNAAAAATTVYSQGFELPAIASALKKIPTIPGRQELIAAGQNFSVMVDYAYEPVSQKKIYELLSLLPHQRIIHVTGSAGGGRDKSRRAVLGELAGHNADIVIVTDEDPYDEDPQSIIDQVAAGVVTAGKKINEDLFKILDRKTAIQQALSRARENDFVLITGKGAEQAMCVANGKKIPWDDRQIVRDFFKQQASLQ